jgi:hypothetical protein
MTTPPAFDLSDNYRAAWSKCRQLRMLSLLLWLGFVPFLWIIRFPLEWMGPSIAEYGFGAIAVLYALIWMYFGVTLQTWDCPLCGDRFSATWYNMSVFATKCVHCGLRKFEVPSLDEQEWRPS